jgi:hypothetical protein
MSLSLCLAFLAGLAAAQHSLDECPASIPRNQYLDVYGDACYQFVVNGNEDYLHARQDCRARGGNLAVTKSKDVQNYIQSKLTSLGVHDTVWIGLNDIDTENTFVWEDGTLLQATKSNWAEGSGPRDGFLLHRLEDCVAIDMQKGGLWVDYYCQNELFGLISYEKKYICQFYLVPTTPAPTTVATPAPTSAATTATPQKMTIHTIVG